MNTHVPVKPLSSFVTIVLLTISLIAAPRAQEQPAANASAPSAAVLIGDFTFTPAEITVAPGTTLVLIGNFTFTPAEITVAPGTTLVLIRNFTFTPAEITVAPGTTVTWTNGDDIPHTVTATNKAFRSKAMDTDQHYSFTFTAPGTYEYFCSLHPHMQGKVIVK